MKANVEQLEAAYETAMLRNPHRERIAQIKAQKEKLDAELDLLLSDEEREADMRLGFARIEEHDRFVQMLTIQELGDLISERVLAELPTDSIGCAAIHEMLTRQGHEQFDDEADE